MRSHNTPCLNHDQPKTSTQVPQSVITDKRLLAEIRRLIAATRYGEGLAGFRTQDNGRENVCLEPGCSCHFDTCGPFRDPATRCTAFETALLPASPELERAYWAHLRGDPAPFRVRRCAHLDCRRRCRDDATAFCEWHAETREREAKRVLRARRQRPLPVAGE